MLSTYSNAYQHVHKTTASGRDLEAHVLTNYAVKLKDCRDDEWDHPGFIAKLFETLNINRQVWAIFRLEVSKESCQLPQDIRLNITKLAIIVEKQTWKIKMAPDKEKLDLLININLGIAAGLRRN